MGGENTRARIPYTWLLKLAFALGSMEVGISLASRHVAGWNAGSVKGVLKVYGMITEVTPTSTTNTAR